MEQHQQSSSENLQDNFSAITLSGLEKIGKLSDSGTDNTWSMLSEESRLKAALKILLGIALLFALSMVLAAFHTNEESAAILEICKTILPPLATLIVAFYFKEKG